MLASCKLVKPISEVNMAHVYARNAPASLRFSMAASPSNMLVFCRVSFFNPEVSAEKPAFWEKYKMDFQVRSGYESSTCLFSDSIRPEMLIRGSGSSPVFQISLPESASDRVLLIRIRQRYARDEYLFDCRIPGDEHAEPNPFCLFSAGGKIPVTEKYARVGDTLMLRSFDYRKTSMQANFIPFSPAVAMPPMATVPLLETEPAQIYPVSIGLNEPRVFKQPGYYFITDSSGKAGFGFAITSGDYPLVSTASELIDPMVYISTRDERKTLLLADNSKQALDQFWLKISPQKDRARELIKKYFLNIEDANRYFTTERQGWKTDRGMVMAIYGPPYLVFRNEDSETWIYEKGTNLESTVFYFFRKKGDNYSDIWELKRLGDYDRVWYGVVDLWRKGSIDR